MIVFTTRMAGFKNCLMIQTIETSTRATVNIILRENALLLTPVVNLPTESPRYAAEG
jgi:hypothetical protein